MPPEPPSSTHRIGRYRIVRELGRGGMGVVYEAVDDRDGGRVALKTLHPAFGGTEGTFRQRFEGEAHIAALLRSPYCVRLLDFGAEGDRYYIVMEYVEGHSVADEVRGGPIDVRRALRIAVSTARALEEAAGHGIVHRDIKPANILLTADGRVKVTDFGIARHEAGSGMTMAGVFVGTAEYAAPEQARGATDARTDIYAVGCTLFTMLTGRPPFLADSVGALLQAHQSQEPDFSLLRHLPPSVVNPIRRCLEKDPRDRYQNASELANALERAMASLPTDPATPVPAPQPPPRAPIPPAAPTRTAEPTRVAPGQPVPALRPVEATRVAPAPAPGHAQRPAAGVDRTLLEPQTRPDATRTARGAPPAPYPMPSPAGGPTPGSHGSGGRRLGTVWWAVLGALTAGAVAGLAVLLFGGDDGAKQPATPAATAAGSVRPERSPTAAATETPAAPEETPAPETPASPTAVPSPPAEASPAVPARSIEAGEWNYNFTVMSNNCGGDPVVGTVFGYVYVLDEIREPRDGYISDREPVRVTHIGGTYVANLIFNFDNFSFDYPIDGGHAYIVNVYNDSQSGIANLTETYQDGASTCSIYMTDG